MSRNYDRPITSSDVLLPSYKTLVGVMPLIKLVSGVNCPAILSYCRTERFLYWSEVDVPC